MSERYYSLAEVEQLLSVSRRTLLRWITNGRLRAEKLGIEPGRPGHWRVAESALAELHRPKT